MNGEIIDSLARHLRFLSCQTFEGLSFIPEAQCGAAGLEEESMELFDLARKASGESRGKGWDFKLYSLMAGIMGWRRLGRVACYSDSIRK